jgi:sugar lactone lactonase YvrE
MTERGNVEFTIDARADPPVLWVLGPGKNPSGQSLLRVEDRGERLVVTGDAFDRDRDAISLAGNLAVDRAADLVYITDTRGQVWRYDGRTGAGGLVKLDATLLAVGPDGRVVSVSGWHSPLACYRRGLKAQPVAGDGKSQFAHFYGRAGRGCSLGGLAIDHRGWIWALQEGGGMFVRAFEPDGMPVPAPRSHPTPGEGRPAPAIVSGLDIHASCVRVDRGGNIYIGWLGRPESHRPPPGFEKDEAYRQATGSVLKFGPEGGRRLDLEPGRKPPAGAVLGFEGVEELYPGLAPFSQWRCAGSCVCTKPRFDVDEFGRLFIPNAITFSVTVMDNAANRLATFGHYGNFDAGVAGSAEPEPPIPLGWPTNAAVAGDHVYVADVLNHRIVRVDLAFEAGREVALR